MDGYLPSEKRFQGRHRKGERIDQTNGGWHPQRVTGVGGGQDRPKPGALPGEYPERGGTLKGWEVRRNRSEVKSLRRGVVREEGKERERSRGRGGAGQAPARCPPSHSLSPLSGQRPVVG